MNNIAKLYFLLFLQLDAWGGMWAKKVTPNACHSSSCKDVFACLGQTLLDAESSYCEGQCSANVQYLAKYFKCQKCPIVRIKDLNILFLYHHKNGNNLFWPEGIYQKGSEIPYAYHVVAEYKGLILDLDHEGRKPIPARDYFDDVFSSPHKTSSGIFYRIWKKPQPYLQDIGIVVIPARRYLRDHKNYELNATYVRGEFKDYLKPFPKIRVSDYLKTQSNAAK